MSGVRIPGAWSCLLVFVMGLTGPASALAQEDRSSDLRERWLSADPDAAPEPETASPWETRSRRNSRKWGLLGSGVGLVTGVGLALWVKSEADERYETYLETADPDLARAALDSAERYDRATLIGWGLAQVSFVAFIYFLTREGERPLIPAEGEPLVRPMKDGVQVGFRVAP